jgi:hypothetical protein
MQDCEYLITWGLFHIFEGGGGTGTGLSWLAAQLLVFRDDTDTAYTTNKTRAHLFFCAYHACSRLKSDTW